MAETLRPEKSRSISVSTDAAPGERAKELAAADATRWQPHDGERVIERSGDIGADGRSPAGVTTMVWRSRSARQRFPRLASHDDRMTDRERAKAFQVVGEAPWQSVTDTNDAVRRDRGDECERMRRHRRDHRKHPVYFA
jgi:hypothetical protein